ncbi:distal tail protein Dit [Aeribacillus composti]|uniref:distal tail protein Dit n=1 Tax=Aeribacillus composti TaxID=1868734 RepID=UPI002E21200F|nr:phage tail family protein [Aeribacillus composti]
MTFRGIRKDYITIIRGRKRPPWAPLQRNILTVPGLPGGYLTDTVTNPRQIEVPVLIKANSFPDLQKLKEDLAGWLVTDTPQELIFDDEPDRVYFAVVDESLDLEEIVKWGHGTIKFLCPDPYKYGPEKEAIFPSDVVSLNYNGTAPGDPLFEMEATQPITFAMIQNQNEEYMMIGKPIDVTDTPYAKYERVFYSDCDSLTGWTTAAPGEIDGNIAGTMQTNGTRFQASDYGTGASWHGPAIKTSLPEVLTDFKMTAWIALYNGYAARQVGRVEIYLLDPNGNQVGKVAMKDTRTLQSLAWGEARAGDKDTYKYLINEYGDKPGNWNDFAGHVELSREGNRWRAYFAMVDTSTGRHHTRRIVEWVDTENKFTRNVAQVVVHVGQFGSNEPISCGVYSINIFKINPNQSNKVPYIAQPGDIITFDHTTKDILINGESRKDLKDFGARFFELQKGENQFVVLPSNSFAVRVRYRERFL